MNVCVGPEIEKKALYLGAGSKEADNRHRQEAYETQRFLAESWGFLRVTRTERQKAVGNRRFLYAGELKSAPVGFDSPAFFCVYCFETYVQKQYTFIRLGFRGWAMPAGISAAKVRGCVTRLWS